MVELLLQLAAAFAATLSFTVIFNAPRRELVFCGLSGALSWGFYYCSTLLLGDDALTVAVLSSVIASSLLSRFLSHRRRMPVTIYLIGGIIPIVPGAGVYYTMDWLLRGVLYEAIDNGLYTLKVSGLIAIGILIVFSIPAKVFIKREKNGANTTTVQSKKA
jgi:uncharacterized membrane protein YjjB (DUF3815 family)